MSYELEAYLLPMSALEATRDRPVPDIVYRLTDALGLVPLCGTVRLDEGWPSLVSRGTTVARISASYFGGHGSQAATVWSDGEIVADGVDVNAALRALGVRRAGGEDEWDTVGLGRFRRTESWAAAAIRAARLQADDPLTELLAALRYTSPNRRQQEKVRAAAAADLGELGDEAAIPHLIAAVEAGGEQGLRIEAASALARIGRRGLSLLAGQLRADESASDPRWARWRSRSRLLVAEALVRLGVLKPAALAARRKTEADVLNAKRDPSRFFPIINALGEAGPAAAPFTDDLAVMLRHWRANTRGDAARALAEIGPAAANAVPALIETLRDEESFVRSYAAQALGAIGPAAAAALPALHTCLGDDVDYVRENARAAIAAIDENAGRDYPRES